MQGADQITLIESCGRDAICSKIYQIQPLLFVSRTPSNVRGAGKALADAGLRMSRILVLVNITRKWLCSSGASVTETDIYWGVSAMLSPVRLIFNVENYQMQSTPL
jgi:hypothetical protein